MRIILPSLGHLGLKSVEMRQPTLDDIRAMHMMNQEPDLLKEQFVKRLVDCDWTKVTYYDFEYLFTVAAFAVTFNQIQYTIDCKGCGEEKRYVYSFGNEDVVTLEHLPKVVKKRVFGETYEYHVLSAQNHFDAVEYAMAEDNFKDAYDDAIAAFTFGKTLNDIEWLMSLPISIYVSAHLYHRVCFHGVHLYDEKTCEKCGRVSKIELDIPPSILLIDLSEIMDYYNSVSNKISFESFINFTLPEYQQFIESLNRAEKR